MGLMGGSTSGYQDATQAAMQKGLRFKYDPTDATDADALMEWYRQYLGNQELNRNRTEGFVDDYSYTRNPLADGVARTDVVNDEPLGDNKFRVTYRDGSQEVQDRTESGMVSFGSKYIPMATQAVINYITSGAGALAGAIGGGVSQLASSGGNVKAGAVGAVAGGIGGYMRGGTGVPGSSGSELNGLQASTADIAPPAGYQDTLGPYVNGGNGLMDTGDPTQGIAPPTGYSGELGKYVTGMSNGVNYSKLAQQGLKQLASLGGGGGMSAPSGLMGTGMSSGATDNQLRPDGIPIPSYLKKQQFTPQPIQQDMTWKDYAENTRRNQRGYYGQYIA